MTMIAELTPTEWRAGMEKKIAALVQLVDCPTLGGDGGQPLSASTP